MANQQVLREIHHALAGNQQALFRFYPALLAAINGQKRKWKSRSLRRTAPSQALAHFALAKWFWIVRFFVNKRYFEVNMTSGKINRH
ncbi:hypothetical protein HNQ44_001454 [Planomicrobium koreense]|uniref:Uncharacterized protein n=1 Tax=Planococcus koreensis TaxID=112331 RepID=A0A7W8CQZ3_9BACL|nr:hypothetical protein [Planococcus koreensis]MBB5180030.1 hypothetical protein [Planococcus koreensis]